MENYGVKCQFYLLLKYTMTMNSNFKINDRFLIESASNKIVDEQLHVTNRLEPRLMKLLVLLASKPGEVMERATLITQIWDDYPGADEGLSQAISFLRKALDDQQRTLICTVSKKGYFLKGKVVVVQPDQKAEEQVKRFNKPFGTLIAGSVLLVLLILILWSRQKSSVEKELSVQDSVTNQKEMRELQATDSMNKAEAAQQR